MTHMLTYPTAQEVNLSGPMARLGSGQPFDIEAMKTTLKQIRAHSPCGMSLESGQREGYLLLKHNLGAGYGDTTPISIPQIIDSNGLDDALWCLRAVDGFDREMRLFAVWCARRVQHLMTDPRSVQALDVAERFANGLASSAELDAARAAAWAAARAAALDAALDAARATALAAALDAALDAAWAAARDAALDAARATALAALDAKDAATDAQTAELRRVCAAIDAGQDPYPSPAQPTTEIAAS